MARHRPHHVPPRGRGQQLIDQRVRQQRVGGAAQPRLETRNILFKHAKGGKTGVAAQLVGLRDIPQQAFIFGRISDQHRPDGRLRLVVRVGIGVVDAGKARLRNTVLVAEVDKVPVEVPTVARDMADEAAALFERHRLRLDAVEFGDFVGVDGGNQVHLAGIGEGEVPMRRCAVADVAKLHRPALHALGELVGKAVQRCLRHAKRGKARAGDADVEA